MLITQLIILCHVQHTSNLVLDKAMDVTKEGTNDKLGCGEPSQQTDNVVFATVSDLNSNFWLSLQFYIKQKLTYANYGFIYSNHLVPLEKMIQKSWEALLHVKECQMRPRLQIGLRSRWWLHNFLLPKFAKLSRRNFSLTRSNKNHKMMYALCFLGSLMYNFCHVLKVVTNQNLIAIFGGFVTVLLY